MTRMTSRSAACLGAVTLFAALAAMSFRLDTASQEIAAAAPESAALATVGIDIPALTATAGKADLPVLAVRDPI